MTAYTDSFVDCIRRLTVVGIDLPSFAAEDALETLLENWKASLRDGTDLEPLVADVEGVIEYLQDFRNKVLAVFPEAQPRPVPMEG